MLLTTPVQSPKWLRLMVFVGANSVFLQFQHRTTNLPSTLVATSDVFMITICRISVIFGHTVSTTITNVCAKFEAARVNGCEVNQNTVGRYEMTKWSWFLYNHRSTFFWGPVHSGLHIWRRPLISLHNVINAIGNVCAKFKAATLNGLG